MKAYRNPYLLKAVAELECMACGVHGRTQASHSNQLADGKGMALKAPDSCIAALCVECHAMVDQGHDMAKEERKELWRLAHIKTLRALIERGYLKVVKV